MHSQAEILYTEPHNKSFRTTESSMKVWTTLDVFTIFVVDPASASVQHASRRTPVVFREDAKTEVAVLKKKRAPVKRNVQHRICNLVAVVVVVSKPGKIRICLDPPELNEVIKRSKYHISTIEKFLPKLCKIKVATFKKRPRERMT